MFFAGDGAGGTWRRRHHQRRRVVDTTLERRLGGGGGRATPAVFSETRESFLCAYLTFVVSASHP